MAETMQALHEEADALIRAMYLGRVGWAARERLVIGLLIALQECFGILPAVSCSNVL